MTWGKVSDDLHAHPKVLQAGLEAMGLWLLCMSYSCCYLTDGHVLRHVLEHLSGSPEAAARGSARLVAAGLWRQTGPDSWVFHDWHDYQPTKESVAAEKLRKSAAGKKGGQARCQARAQAGAQVPAKQNSSPSPSPSPSPIEKEKIATEMVPPLTESALAAVHPVVASSRTGSSYAEAVSTAYAEGIASITGTPYVFSNHSERVKITGIVDILAPKDLRGPDLIAWVKLNSAGYASAKDAKFECGYAADKFAQWARSGGVLRSKLPAPKKSDVTPPHPNVPAEWLAEWANFKPSPEQLAETLAMLDREEEGGRH